MPGSRSARPTSRPRCSRGTTGDEVDERVLRKMSYRAEPEGVIAIVEIPHRTLLPDAHAHPRRGRVEKPGNLGAMARTADAAGVRRASRRRRELRSVEPERDPRLYRRRLHAPDRHRDARRRRTPAAPEGRRRPRGRAHAHRCRLHRTDRSPDRRRGRRAAGRVPHARRRRGRDSHARLDRRLAERERVRRRAALRGRAPAPRGRSPD